MAAHLEALGGEADGGLALEPSIPHGHLKVVDGSVHGSGAVGLHDSDGSILFFFFRLSTLMASQ